MIRGMDMGAPVQSGRLQVWPVFGPRVNIGFVSNIHLADDEGGYGSLGIRTDHPRGGIAPHGLTFFFGGGQDRALRESAYVPAGEVVRVPALCVEPAQGGFWEGQDTIIKALPASLLAALPEGSGHDYSDLWDDIQARHEALGRNGSTVAGLLEGKSYIVPKDMVDDEARGAMIAIDGRIVALQIAPNPDAFQEWWNDFGLAESYAFEAQTLPKLPPPLGVLDGDLEIEGTGMHRATYLDVLRGWIYVRSGRLCFASLLEKEGLTIFKRHGQRSRPESTEQPMVSGEWTIPDE